MSRAIGVMDSGVGGLTVAREIIYQLPNEQIIYLGDTARCPYGPRPEEEVRRFTWEMAEFLYRQDIKMLVIACNTATAAALEEIRTAFDIPVIGVISPGARSAIKYTKNNCVGILGTAGTIKSRAYEKVLCSLKESIQTYPKACPKFVPLVESGEYNSSMAKKIVAETLSDMRHHPIDTLILGCTHYPLLQPLIEQYMGPSVKVISSGDETAREVSAILSYRGELNARHERQQHLYYTTGSPVIFGQVAREWMNDPSLVVESVKLP
ncbi:glutamate racemase [Jeotgalibacillus haloalkalitolerans]|uniref:Glutamate racemase n=1 Tax=Jeotgalibacillus haloalkalitolerans TaxID=3104292 RepID=A0ABU5KMM1_9BACL|nr:glutamate racemase [Jeotgalibacillus sp. HH7-29]MDZ5712394.1 glutamate racemase [Jeotgalibacillus sp. HH7-29]